MSEKIRLDKYLADAGIGTRSQVKGFIQKGLIEIDNTVCRDSGFKVKPGGDRIYFRGEEIGRPDAVYFMMNKPSGIISATKDNFQRTVLDILSDAGVSTGNLFPVGRLDKDTEGLLLITGDGALAHNLLSPRKHVAKTYYVRVDKPLAADMAEAFQNGIDIGEEKKMLPSRLHLLTDFEAEITIVEGKFHQVKRMFKAVGYQVTYLKRLSMGTLRLDKSLLPGDFRPLTEHELSELKALKPK